MKDERENILKLNFILLGEERIWKTSLIDRYISNFYIENHLGTIGMDIRSKVLEINDTYINISITDTPGNERFRSLTRMYYKDTDGFLIGIDLTEQSTLEQVNYWIRDVEKNRNKEYPISWVLFGNKCDDKENIKVKEEDIKKIQDKYNIKYFETSAKIGTNVNSLFEYLVKLTFKIKGILNKIGFPNDIPLEAVQFEREFKQLYKYLDF